MIQDCARGSELAARLLSEQHWSEEEKAHFLACVPCQRAVHAAVEQRRKTEGPRPDAEPLRPAVKRKLERARQALERELGISLASGPRPAGNPAKAS